MAVQVNAHLGVIQVNHNLFRLKVYCRCDTTKSTFDDAIINHRIQGEIVCVDTVPGPEAAPQVNYDLYLYNAESVDVMGGALEDRGVVPERAWPWAVVGQTTYITETPVDGCVTITMANNNVNGADWTMYIYFRKPVDEGLG